MIIKVCNKIIEYSFYGLFFLVPLVFTSNTFELFEFNKMWLTFILTIIIGTCWIIKMILQRRIFIQRTPLDIPIVLLLLSQILSTIFSIDRHVSLWGYYSRFNGGLLSIVSYIFLYYAFVSNFLAARGVTGGGGTQGVARPEGVPLSARRELATEDIEWDEGATGPRAITMVKRLIFVSLFSGAIVALWGLPSHFGYDPTCLLFRGHLDVSCWTDAFQPKVRIFSTLGQPDWLAAYLAILIPISIAFFINNLKSNLSESQIKNQESGIRNYVLGKKNIHNSLFIILTSLFYVDLLYTRARSGFIALWISLIVVAGAFIFIYKNRLGAFFRLRNAKLGIAILAVIFIVITFFTGTSISQLDKFTFGGLKESFSKKQTVNNKASNNSQAASSVINVGELGGTDSGKIRLLVWEGAIDIWRHYPLFGSGVETFAFSYYQYRPAAHNLVSEWNYLYNKAHNEYLNYLATTGTFGLGTYLTMIGFFLTIVILNLRDVMPNSFRHLSASKNETLKQVQGDNNRIVQHDTNRLLILALLTSYLSILISNFFGFSVVIVNIYLFLLPAFVFVLTDMLNSQKAFVFPKSESGIKNNELSLKFSKMQIGSALFIILASLFMILTLAGYWNADKNYAYGYNLDRAGNYQQAYPYLHKAVEERQGEPVFKDEMAINDATLAVALLMQKTTATDTQVNSVATSLVKEAIETNNQITSAYPNNVLFWKSRTRIFYVLSQADPRYLPSSLDAIKKAQMLAPTDANISYNLGVLEGQNNKLDEAIKTLENTIKLKPDYRDAYYALGLFYHQKAVDDKGRVIDLQSQQKAIDTMQYILNHLQSNDAGAKQALDAWNK